MYIMRVCFFVCFFVLFLFSSCVCGVSVVDCFDYYKFGGVVFEDLHTGFVSYPAGGVVDFSFGVVNELAFPVADGGVFLEVRRNNSEVGLEGDHLVDEFFLVENVSLLAGERRFFNFSWVVPEGAVDGVYSFNVFFCCVA
jgi:hypothetical protein